MCQMPRQDKEPHAQNIIFNDIKANTFIIISFWSNSSHHHNHAGQSLAVLQSASPQMLMQEFVVGLKYGVQMEWVHAIATLFPKNQINNFEENVAYKNYVKINNKVNTN